MTISGAHVCTAAYLSQTLFIFCLFVYLFGPFLFCFSKAKTALVVASNNEKHNHTTKIGWEIGHNANGTHKGVSAAASCPWLAPPPPPPHSSQEEEFIRTELYVCLPQLPNECLFLALLDNSVLLSSPSHEHGIQKQFVSPQSLEFTCEVKGAQFHGRGDLSCRHTRHSA